jgi:hypothetical protein
VAQREGLRDEEVRTTLRNYVRIPLINISYLFIHMGLKAAFSFSQRA